MAKSNKKSRVVEKNFKKAREIKKMNKNHDILMDAIRQIVHNTVSDVYRSSEYASMPPSARMKKATGLVIGTVARELDIDAQTVISILLWEECLKLFREYENKIKVLGQT